jgi:hypothetical protein
MTKIRSLTIRNRAAGAVLAVAILGLGAVFLTVGLALLLGLVVAGGVLGTGVAIYRRLHGGRGPWTVRLGGRRAGASAKESGLDPALEIEPPRGAIVRPRDTTD